MESMAYGGAFVSGLLQGIVDIGCLSVNSTGYSFSVRLKVGADQRLDLRSATGCLVLADFETESGKQSRLMRSYHSE